MTRLPELAFFVWPREYLKYACLRLKRHRSRRFSAKISTEVTCTEHGEVWLAVPRVDFCKTCFGRSYAVCASEICFIFINSPISFVASSRGRFGITFYLFVCHFPPSWCFPVCLRCLHKKCARGGETDRAPVRNNRIRNNGAKASGFIWISAVTREEVLLGCSRWLYCAVC